MSLKAFVQGDAEVGFWVEFGREKPLLRHNGEGEFSAVFADPEGTVAETVGRFRGQWAAADGDRIELGGVLALPRLQAEVGVRVEYRQVGDSLFSKRIELAADRELRFSLANRLEALTPPERYWSFQNADSEGGPVYEIYPAIGMVLEGRAYGLLTDNGYRNRWTRISRQKDADAYLAGLDVQPDAELTVLAGADDREADRHYSQFKFGEALDYSDQQAYEDIPVPDMVTWRGEGLAELRVADSGELHMTGGTERHSGVAIPLELDKNEMYEIAMTYRSSHELEMSLLDANGTSYFEWGYECGAFRDHIPATADGECGTFSKRLFASRFKTNRQPLLLKIRNDLQTEGRLDFAVVDVRIRRFAGKPLYFHTVGPSSPASLRLFLFESSAASHRDVQIAAQIKLAEGLGFEGTDSEKMMYADNQMLIWIRQHDLFEPHLVPNLNYHPDMYLRDAFWHAQAVDDREVSERCWSAYAATQHEDGQLDTLVMPYFYRPSRDDNDSTMFFIMWAYLNRVKYGTVLDREPLDRAFASIVRNHSPQRDGKYWSRTAGWLDTIWNANKIRAINQGHYAVMLQCAKRLGLPVGDDEIERAKDVYRALYDPGIRSLKWSEDEDYISPSVLLGEFMNLWLFGEPILSDEAVVGTVERFPVVIRGVPCICDSDGRFFTEANKPWEGKYTWRNGVYHNGGSWFLYEYLAYVAAARHSSADALQRMQWRVDMEFSRENEPYSHEFIPLSDDSDDWWPSTGVFAWNTFMIQANRVAAAAITAAQDNH